MRRLKEVEVSENSNDFFNKKRGWISQLYDLRGNHVGTRQAVFRNEGHLMVTTYDSNDGLKSIEHIFPVESGETYLSYDSITKLTRKFSEKENSKLFDLEGNFRRRFLEES